MIPHQLTLTNFLSYRDTVILDLHDIHLACISGLNGAGKSTILDGITWALFGHSRSKSDDDIVNRSAAGNGHAAEVQFVFELEGSIYRVIRRKQARKVSELELQMRSSEEALGWRTITEAKQRETQAALNQLLRMNYEIFINASFLLQGEADEFTTKTPDKRKQILSEILGVNQWEDYKAMATEKRKETDADVTFLIRQLADIDRELAEEEERRQALEIAVSHEQNLKTQLDSQEKLRAQISQTRLMADQQRQLIERLNRDLVRSRGKLQQIEADLTRRQAEMNQYRQMLEQRPEIEQRFEEWQRLEREISVWQEKSDAYNLLLTERRPHEMTVATVKAGLEQQQRELDAQREKAGAATIEREQLGVSLSANQALLAELKAQIAELFEQRQQWEIVRNELQRLEADRQLLKQEHTQLIIQRREIDQLRRQQPDLAAEKQTAEEKLTLIVADVANLARDEQVLADKRAEHAALKAEQTALYEVMQKQKERIDRLQAASGEAADHTCPLCGQDMTDEHRVEVLSRLTSEGKGQGDRYRGNKARIEGLEVEMQALREAILRRQTVEKERNTFQQRFSTAEARLSEVESALAKWDSGPHRARLSELELKLADQSMLDDLRDRKTQLEPASRKLEDLEAHRSKTQNAVFATEARLTQINTFLQNWEEVKHPLLESVSRQLAEGSYAVDAYTALREVDKGLETIGYDVAAHQLARLRRGELLDVPEQYRQLQTAEAAVKPLAETLADLEQRHDENETRIAELVSEQTTAEQLLGELETAATDWQIVEKEVLRLREEVAIAGRSVGAARQKVDVLDDLRRNAADLLSEKRAGERRLAVLKELEQACGRRGVQALLIESALPEIEDYANQLLEELSGGEMRVKFETQRELKTSSNQAETLDIKISDGTGERPYENFSGGEKFRVNFAIRLALSQVLAHRAGARLKMLVIDEGFGSQDMQGRQRLVEAITAVQDDFACILVITHIDELRDKFPVRIEVEKFARGSEIQVVAV
ncbi:MAG: SMC family ATPase [Chloroflexota bacterium]|jgi:DNA repair protein SbcC/Rad50